MGVEQGGLGQDKIGPPIPDFLIQDQADSEHINDPNPNENYIDDITVNGLQHCSELVKQINDKTLATEERRELLSGLIATLEAEITYLKKLK